MCFISLNLAADRLKVLYAGHSRHNQNQFNYPNRIHLLLEVHHLLGLLENGVSEKSKWFTVDQIGIRWSREESSHDI